MKFCKDCKHCKVANLSSGDDYSECVAPKSGKPDPVTGKFVSRWEFCSTQRMGPWIMAYPTFSCGPQARWFEPKGD